MTADRTSIIAAIGPSIGFDAFEVGPEVLAEFVRVFGKSAPIAIRDDDKGTVDLRAAIALQLVAAGVSHDRIDCSDRCTYRDSTEFFSHRRDNGITGRMAAVIGTA
jgi:copper oxidase (laccase) domain-containing protein